MAATDDTAAGSLRPFSRSDDGGFIVGSLRDAPVVFVNAEADLQALSGVALARLDLLEKWVLMLSTSESTLNYDPQDVAALLLPMVEDGRKLVEVVHDRLTAAEQGKQDGEAEG